MNEGPRRRRLRETQPVRPRKDFPLFPLLIVVILGGFGLGALISRGFQKPAATTTTSTTVAALPAQSPAASELPVATASGSPEATPSAKPSAHPTPHRVALTTAKPSPSPSAEPSRAAQPTASAAPTSNPATPKPVTAQPATPKPATPKPVAPKPITPKPITPKPVTPKPPTTKPAATPPPTGAGAAAATARSYLDALIRGDFASANTALGRGPDGTGFPEQEAVDRTSRINEVHTLSNGDGTYKIEIEVAGKKGTFYCTFQAARNEASAFFLSDHYCIRIQ